MHIEITDEAVEAAWRGTINREPHPADLWEVRQFLTAALPYLIVTEEDPNKSPTHQLWQPTPEIEPEEVTLRFEASGTITVQVYPRKDFAQQFADAVFALRSDLAERVSIDGVSLGDEVDEDEE